MPQKTLKRAALREALRNRNVFWTGHAQRQLFSRSIKRQEVLSVIQNGGILEAYLDEKPHPKCLMMGFVRDKQPLYVSLAFDGERIIIITVHWMDEERWSDPWARRKQP